MNTCTQNKENGLKKHFSADNSITPIWIQNDKTNPCVEVSSPNNALCTKVKNV